MNAIDKGYRQCIGALGMYSPLPQTAPQLADGFRAASNWLRGGDGFKQWFNDKNLDNYGK